VADVAGEPEEADDFDDAENPSDGLAPVDFALSLDCGALELPAVDSAAD